MEMKDIVTADAKAHKELDTALTSARKASLKIEELVEEGVKANMVKALEAKLRIHQARQITGMIADVGAASAQMHIDHTAVAVKNKVDAGGLTDVAGVTLPIARGGGTR